MADKKDNETKTLTEENLPTISKNDLPDGVLSGPVPPEGLPISIDEAFELKKGNYDVVLAWADKVRVALPTAFEDGGPVKLGNCLLAIKAFQHEGEQFQMDMMKEKGRVDEGLIAFESTVGIMHDELLRRLKIVGSTSDREAAIGRRLRYWNNELSIWRGYLRKLVTIEQVLKLKLRYLKQTSSDIRTLQKLYEQHFQLQGGPPPGTGSSPLSEKETASGREPGQSKGPVSVESLIATKGGD